MPFRSGLWKLPMTDVGTCWPFMDRREGGALAIDLASCLSLLTDVSNNVSSKASMSLSL